MREVEVYISSVGSTDDVIVSFNRETQSKAVVNVAAQARQRVLSYIIGVKMARPKQCP